MKRKEFFADYEKETRDGKTEWVYHGVYYSFDMPENKVKGHKLRVLFLQALTAVLLILPGLLPVRGAYAAYVILPYVLMFFPVLIGLLDAVMFLFSEYKMTKHSSETYGQIDLCAKFTIFLCAALMVGQAVSMALRGVTATEILFLFAAAAPGATSLALIRRIKKHAARLEEKI